MLSTTLKAPKYIRIIHTLVEAINEIKELTGQTEFEWIKEPPKSSKELAFGVGHDYPTSAREWRRW